MKYYLGDYTDSEKDERPVYIGGSKVATIELGWLRVGGKGWMWRCKGKQGSQTYKAQRDAAKAAVTYYAKWMAGE
jgi:hypothetical protein